MTEHDQFFDLVSRITADVLRGMGYTAGGGSSSAQTCPAGSACTVSGQSCPAGPACTVEQGGGNEYGACPRVLPKQVEEYVDAGAARVGGGLASGEGLKDGLAGLIDHTLL